ncbi:Ig-like domain-containing protein [candidate division KSB1 bacterium]|nr:Ig-like domain-containing protein [candidate division KSB1 bacterium]
MRAFKLFWLKHVMAYCCAVAALLFLPLYGFTQSESVPAESVPNNATPLPNETITVVINVDVSNLQAPNNRLGSYQATLLWNPAVLQFVNTTPAPSPWNAPNINLNDVAAGKIEWNDFQTGGSTGKVNILNVNLRVIGAAGAMDTLKLSFAELFTTTFRDIRSQLIIQNGTITVRSPNRAPVLAAIFNQTMNEGDTLDVPIAATDPDGGRITLVAENLPSFGSLTDNGNGTGRIRFTPGFFAAGIYQNIQVIATDDGTPALSDTASFRLTVNNVNRAPQIRPPDAITLNEGDTLNITLSAEDPDGDSIVLRMSNLPAFGSFVDNGNGTGILRLRPGRDDAGAYPQITLVATDNGAPSLSDSKQLDLTVIDRFPSLVCKTEIASPADSSVTFSDSVEVCVVTQVSGAVGELTKVCAVNGIPLVGLCVKVPVINGFNTIIATCTFTDSLSSCVSADTIRVEARTPDTLKCSLTLTPQNGTIICGDSVEVVGTLTITGGVPPYTKTCEVNGVPARDTATGFILKLPCVPGKKNTFIAACKVTDAGNRTATCLDTVNVICPLPPVCTLEIIAPGDSALINGNTVKVTAVTSILGGVPPFTKTCNVNGVAATVTGDTLMATVPLIPGWNDLIATCTVTDSCGKAVVCSDTIRVEARIIDSLRCSLALTPPSGTIICGDSVEVVGTLTITGGVPPYTKTCDVNGVPAGDTASGFILKLPVAPGNNTFIATCKVTDAGNRETVCRDTIRVIGLAPPVCTLEITTPADSAVTCDKKVKVAAVTSITGGVPPFTITCSINGVAATVAGNTITADVPLARGWNNLIAMCTVTDSCGKTAVCRDTIRVQSVNDKTAPTCTFTQETRSVTGTFFDNESGIAKIEALFLSHAELTVDPFVPGAKKVNFRLDGVGSEPHIGFDIKVTDLCGNSHICDPVLLSLSTDGANRQYTLKFRSVDRYLILENHGLSEIRVDLNGHLFNLASSSSNVRNRNTYVIPEEGSITIDLKPYLLEGENVMRLEIEGRAGTGADFMLIDATHVIDHTLELQPIPMTFELAQNYPNPFNPSTTIRFGVPAHVGLEPAAVQVRIYNTLGELVRTLVNEKMPPGQYAVEWNGQNDRGETVATGIYIYQLVTGGFKQTKKMSFLK